MPSPIPSERAELGPAGRGRWWGAGLAPGPRGQEESIRWGSGGDAGESAESVSFTVVRGSLRPPAVQQQLEVKASGSETRPPCGHPPPAGPGSPRTSCLPPHCLVGPGPAKGFGGCECSVPGGVLTTCRLPRAHYSLTEIQGIAQER